MADSLIGEEGFSIEASDPDFMKALNLAVDYRGDISLELSTEECVEGFLFNLSGESCEMFLAGSSEKKKLSISAIRRLIFSGKDEAKGKSWEDWLKKKSQVSSDAPQEQSVK